MHGRRRVEGNQTRGPERSTMNPVYGQKVTEEARRERLVARGRLDTRGGLMQGVLRKTYYQGRRGRSYLEEELTKSHNVSKYQPEVTRVS